MNKYLCLALGLLLLCASCKQEDTFTGLWNKGLNPEFDGRAFASWNSKGKYKVDTLKISTPLFIRIKKDMGFYTMNCYQFDAAKAAVVADPSVFDFVKFTKEDQFTLISDNKASNMKIDKRIIIQVDPATGTLTMNFAVDAKQMPTDKRINALFRTMFSSGYHKIMEIRRKSEDASIIDGLLKGDHLIKS